MSRLIDADAMLDDVLRQNETIKALGIEELTKMSLTICDGIKQEICNQPTIDAVEVVHGRWNEEGNSCSYIFHCSVCGGVAYFVHGKGRGRNIERRFCGYRYCPNCGAKMDGDCADGERRSESDGK